jgi:hypothetical protein
VGSLVEESIRRFGGDRNRVFLTGFSLGGGGAFTVPTGPGPVHWTALWSVDPNPSPSPNLRQPAIPPTLTPAIPANGRVLLRYGRYFRQPIEAGGAQWRGKLNLVDTPRPLDWWVGCDRAYIFTNEDHRDVPNRLP